MQSTQGLPNRFELRVDGTDYTVDLEKRTVRRGQEDIHLQPLTFEVLETLLRRAPSEVTQDELMTQLSGGKDLPGDSLKKRVHEAIHRVREVFGAKHIVAKTRKGYKLAAEVVPIKGHASARLTVLPPIGGHRREEEDEFRERVAHELTRELGRIAPPELVVVVWSSSGGGGRDPIQTARQLGADYVVSSTVKYDKSRSITFGWQVYKLSDHGVVCGGDREEFHEDDEGEFLRRLAESVVKGMGMEPKPSQVRHSNPIAREAYSKGRKHWEKRTRVDLEKARDYFNEAIRAVETERFFARSYAGVAECCALLALAGVENAKRGELIDRAKKAANKSLRFISDLPEGLTIDAEIKFRFDWDWTAARSTFERAIECNKNYPTAHHWFSLYLTAMGDHKKAKEESSYAQSINPGSCIINADGAWPYYNCGEYDAALENCKKALKIDEDFWVAHWIRGLVFEEQGKYAEAIKELELARRPWPQDSRFMTRVARVLALSGEQGKALEMLRQLREMQKGAHVPHYFLATLCEALGERQQMFDCLDEAFKDKSPTLVFLKVDPTFKNFWESSEFQSLLGRLPFPS